MALSGCGTSGGAEVEAILIKKSPEPAKVELAGNLEPSDLALYHGEGRVKVGDFLTAALRVFPEPPKSAFEIRDLPNAFSDKFVSHGWETAHGEGFGVIETDNRVVGAIYQLEHTRANIVDGLLQEEVSGMDPIRPVRLASGPLKYWFWTSKDQVVMVCSFTTKSGINYTAAVGDRNVMKALGISVSDAKKQMSEVLQLDVPPLILHDKK